jgi:hypothetical protein
MERKGQSCVRALCGEYDDDYAEMADIKNEVQQKSFRTEELKTGEIFPTDLAPVLVSRRADAGGADDVGLPGAGTAGGS